MSKQFRIAWVTQNAGHDYSALLGIADTIMFLTDGQEAEEILELSIDAQLRLFVPETDVIVPSGHALEIFLCGIMLEKHNINLGYCHVAIFKDNEYHIMEISLDR